MSLENYILDKYNVKSYVNECTTYDIINDYVKNNQSEQPFYIIDLGELVKLYQKWEHNLPKIKPYYAVKCNPNPVILHALSCLGASFDCASENEIKTIVELTNDPKRIIFANPCKMSSQIKYARANDVDIMTFDCEEELYKIRLYHPYAKLVLRLAVDDSKSKCKFNSKFGCKIENVLTLINLIKILKLELIGFSFHVGSGCSDVESFYSAIKTTREAYDIAEKQDIKINIIDIGGGFPGINKVDCVTFENIALRVNEAINDFFPNDIVTFIAEPGRYFAEGTHTLILNVIGKKRELYFNTDKNENEEVIVYYLNDGIYGSFNCIYFDHHSPKILPFNEKNEKLHKSKIFGPTCDSIDLIKEEIMLPELAIGEWVYVENFGAYTTAASSSFNGFITTDYKYIYRN
jgi:ornithine decarboxylase